MATYGYRCENGHECSHQHLFCPNCGTPVSAVKLRHADADAIEESEADGARRVLCPVGHTNTPFDIYCGECGTEIHKIAKEPIPLPPQVPVTECPNGHTVTIGALACPVCGRGMKHSTPPVNNTQVPTVLAATRNSQSSGRDRTAGPRPLQSSMLGRTGFVDSVASFVKDYWAAVVVAAVIIFIVCAFFLSSIEVA